MKISGSAVAKWESRRRVSCLTPIVRSISVVSLIALICAAQGPVHAASDASAKRTTPRYKLTAGKGYTVCERYVKMLNSFPPDAPVPVCAQRLHPDFPDFSFPQWETLDVTANMDLVIELERWLHTRGVSLWEGKTKPTTDAWIAEVERRIRTGEVTPRLQRVKLNLVDGKPETLLAYMHDIGRCERDLAKYDGTNASWNYLFLYDENGKIDPRRMDALGGTSSGNLQVLLHQKRPYFIGTYTVGTYSGTHVMPVNFHLQIAMNATTNLRGVSYVVPDRCIVKANSPKNDSK